MALVGKIRSLKRQVHEKRQGAFFNGRFLTGLKGKIQGGIL